ncbi:MAG: saccharopine dehydrogenase C-terminal domain-containing protein [Candidatus Thermoplasmatota archaeon]
MKNILVLGAGMVSRPLVQYMLNQPNYKVKVASRTVKKAEELICKHPGGEAQKFDITTDAPDLDGLVLNSDLVVSLLPYTYHVQVANLCIKHRKHMITTSYVSADMQALDKKAKDADIIILNEIGLDPGIDHMSAMKIIHKVQNEGGDIISFSSYCGALPAPEASTNPFGYKFSWSPRGVVLASKNAARYLKDGKEVDIPGEKLFENYTIKNIEGVGDFEDYPNRNSLPYIDIYGIKKTKTMYRGTLRNIGWCETLRKIVELGLLDDTVIDNLKGLTYQSLIRKLINCKEGLDLKDEIAKYLRIEKYSAVMKRLEWLGLLSDEPLPIQKGSPLDILSARLLEKLQYAPNERDMIVLHHDFIAEKGGKKEKITSTLVDFGIPGGDSAVARTVSIPAAIGGKLILEGKIKSRGVCIPVLPEIYEPVLKELEGFGIKLSEKSKAIVQS